MSPYAQTLPSPAQLVASSGKMKLSSPAFGQSQRIPDKHTLYGQNVRPPLAWSGAPAETKGFALLVTDPDALKVVGREFLHWAVIDIPAGTTSLPEGGPALAGREELANDYGKAGYGGPKPPPGTGVHHYVFALYALRTAKLPLKPGAGLDGVRQAIKLEAIDQAVLVGTYEKK
jgi:Raf kinase inhibitor-like YbhB/YbcL family protein